jgi:YVTN family beta-propeller protein
VRENLESFALNRRFLLLASLAGCIGLAGCALLAGCAATTDDEETDDGASADAFTGQPSADASSGDTVRRIYATVAASQQVVVIDEQSHEILHTLEVGQGPAILISTPDGKKLYAACWKNDTVSAIEVATDQVTNIPMPMRPYVIAMAPDGKYVYAGVNSMEIVVIDTETDTIARSFPTEQLPASLIVSPDGETIYVATIDVFNPGTLRAVSTATGEVIHEPIEVGLVPAWITIGKDGARVYTLNFLSDDISVVNTESWTVEETIFTGAGTQGIIGNVTPDGSRLYVTNHGSGDLIGIDTQTNQIVQTIDLDGRPVGVNFNPEGTRVYVTDFGPESLATGPDLNYLLTGQFTGTGNGQVSVFDLDSGELVGSKISTGPGATSVLVVDTVE